MVEFSKAVRLANKKTTEELQAFFKPLHQVGDVTYQMVAPYASRLSAGQQKQIWSIFEENMKTMYKESSLGWDVKKKKKELFHRLSRFLLTYRTEDAKLVAYTMFRFETEDDEDWLYCYELQVHPESQRQGLGEMLVDALTAIGNAVQMEKVILTVFLSNTNALKFYTKIGFSRDPSSPHSIDGGDEEDQGEGEEGEDEEVDYDLLSKRLAAAQ